MELAIVTIHPNGDTERTTWRVNPEVPIPPGATAIHGINDGDVAGRKTFKGIRSEERVSRNAGTAFV